MVATPNGSARPYFITLKEAANILRVHPETMLAIVKGRRRSTGPRAMKIGAGWRLPYEDFMAWVDSQARSPRQRKK